MSLTDPSSDGTRAAAVTQSQHVPDATFNLRRVQWEEPCIDGCVPRPSSQPPLPNEVDQLVSARPTSPRALRVDLPHTKPSQTFGVSSCCTTLPSANSTNDKHNPQQLRESLQSRNASPTPALLTAFPLREETDKGSPCSTGTSVAALQLSPSRGGSDQSQFISPRLSVINVNGNTHSPNAGSNWDGAQPRTPPPLLGLGEISPWWNRIIKLACQEVFNIESPRDFRYEAINHLISNDDTYLVVNR